MVRHWRWVVVVAVTAVLVALPSAAHLLPVRGSSVGAQTLLARITRSAGLPYSGYAQSRGGLDLPVSTGSVSSVSDLLGGTNQLRVWWRGPQDWRVDTLALTGESDLHADSTGLWSWDYESDTAGRTPTGTAPVRIPRNDDLLPGNLARRLLSEAATSSVRRLGSVRVAGRSAAGLRVDIADPRSTIRHIDVWALPDNGLPLRVQVYGTGSAPVVSTSMLDVSTGTPPASTTAFHPAAGVKVRFSPFGDLVAALDNFGRADPPATLAGLPRRSDLALGAVGVYGRGVMELSALPVSKSLARQIVPSLNSAGGVNGDDPVAIGAGAVNLLLSPPSPRGNRWLLVGTVTPATLRSALTELPPPRGFGPPRRR